MRRQPDRVEIQLLPTGRRSVRPLVRRMNGRLVRYCSLVEQGGSYCALSSKALAAAATSASESLEYFSSISVCSLGLKFGSLAKSCR